MSAREAVGRVGLILPFKLTGNKPIQAPFVGSFAFDFDAMFLYWGHVLISKAFRIVPVFSSLVQSTSKSFYELNWNGSGGGVAVRSCSVLCPMRNVA